MPLSKQKISTNQADLKRKKFMMASIALGAPWEQSQLVIWPVRPCLHPSVI
jgi:hypothetical protein